MACGLASPCYYPRRSAHCSANITGPVHPPNAEAIEFNGTGNTNAIYIAPNGNVGIGTANPLTTLQVKTGTNENFWVYKNLNFSGGVTLDAVNDTDTSNVPMEFHAAVFAFTEGNVGIGTTTPAFPLQVLGTIGAKEVIITANGGSDYVF